MAEKDKKSKPKRVKSDIKLTAHERADYEIMQCADALRAARKERDKVIKNGDGDSIARTEILTEKIAAHARHINEWLDYRLAHSHEDPDENPDIEECVA